MNHRELRKRNGGGLYKSSGVVGYMVGFVFLKINACPVSLFSVVYFEAVRKHVYLVGRGRNGAGGIEIY